MANKLGNGLSAGSWIFHPPFPAHWRRAPLYSLATWVNGLAFRDFHFTTTGKPVIKIAEIKSGITGQTKFTTQTFDAKVLVKYGDMLFSWSGQPETSIDVFWWRDREGWLNQHVFKVTPNEELDPTYFFYLLRYLKPNFVAIARNKQTTGLGHVTKKNLEEIEAAVPPLPEQKAIARILGTLDDKIELNRRMNATLEAMARALFQSWFIDFDPVRRNAARAQNQPSTRPNGHPSPSGRRDGDERADDNLPLTMGEGWGEGLVDLDKLFPDSFQSSELGEIPNRWSVEPVGDVVDCVGGSTPSTSNPAFWEEGVHHWTTPKDFSSLQTPILIDSERKITDAGLAKISSGLLPAGTVLLSSRAPVGYLAISAIPVAINQGFIAMKCSERASPEFVLNWCQSNMTEIKSRATGTTFPEISKKNFRPIPILLPPVELMTAFTTTVRPLYSQITANLHQSRTLATLRDTLLPKLLSGELSVADPKVSKST